MLSLLWLRGLIARRSVRLMGGAVGVAVTVALLTAIGAFIAASSASMTQRALADVPVDWQIELMPGADVSTVKERADIPPRWLFRVARCAVEAGSHRCTTESSPATARVRP